MTNVKLKLMFFLLNALLSVDIIHSRPYEYDKQKNGTTDVVIKFVTNNNFSLAVDSNSDTLMVATETTAENHDHYNSQMEAIMNAEQNRDEHISEKKFYNANKNVSTPEDTLENPNVQMEAIIDAEHNRDKDLSEDEGKSHGKPELFRPDMTSQDREDLERQLNASNSHLEDIIIAERGRENMLTDISEFAPRFEFLIASKINESDSMNKSVRTGSDNELDRLDKNNSDVLRKVEYVELVEVMNPSKIGENKSAYNLLNITGYEVDNDLEPDTRFTDMQTLFLACFATLVPLLGVLFATLLIRCMCRRWCPGCCSKSIEPSESDSSEKDDQEHEQLKSEDATTIGEGLENGDAPSNGSIITMTLKNNHLIVETEERTDITKNGRETKMKYSPDNEGIFVVEVQQSTAYRPNNKSLQNSPPFDPQISTNQALIHRVPEELEKSYVEDSERSSEKYDKALALSSTGLSISDLSMSSTGSHNMSYSYGCQMGYDQGPFGYPLGYPNCDTNERFDERNYNISQEPLISKTPTNPDKPVVTAAIFKQDSIISCDVLQGPGYCIEGSTDGPLLSDVQAREYSLQHLHDRKEKKIENGVAVAINDKIESPKKSLNRADSLPVRLEDEKPVAEKMGTITEDSVLDEEVPKEILKSKRASLPIIRTEVYESVMDAIKPTGSPKFEKFTNDSSPSDILEPPMITITEEADSGHIDD